MGAARQSVGTRTTKFPRKLICGILHHRVPCRFCGELIWTQLKPLCDAGVCNGCNPLHSRAVGTGRGDADEEE